jgi:hypothetical protein
MDHDPRIWQGIAFAVCTGGIVDRPDQKDDPLFEQTRVNVVVSALPTIGLLDDNALRPGSFEALADLALSGLELCMIMSLSDTLYR